MLTPKQEAMAAVRQLLAAGGTAALGVNTGKPGGPMVTMVNMACDGGFRPLVFISALSLHTRCLAADPQACVMLHEAFPVGGDPQTALRVSLSGSFARLAGDEAAAAKAIFLARHPYAGVYAGLGDFACWRMEPASAHIVAGFGRAYDVRFADLASGKAD